MSQVAPEPGLRAGRYVLHEPLGDGGMATVYRAWDSALHVHRAVKVLSPALAKNPIARERFLSEARTTANLHHPHVVTVHDVGEDEGRFYLVMQLIEGGTLFDRLAAQGPLAPTEAATFVLQVLDALEAAHERGVVHRDIKPQNILLTKRGVAKVTDFGIARAVERDRSLTRTGAMMGTWGFMAPEQRSNAKGADARTDLYAVGATLYMLVTGSEPLDLYASNLWDRLYRGIPAEFATFIQGATAYDPDERYPSAGAMKAALERLLPELPEDPLFEGFERGAQGETLMPEGSGAGRAQTWAPSGGTLADSAPEDEGWVELELDEPELAEEPEVLESTGLGPRSWALGLGGLLVLVGLGAWGLRTPGGEPELDPVEAIEPAPVGAHELVEEQVSGQTAPESPEDPVQPAPAVPFGSPEPEALSLAEPEPASSTKVDAPVAKPPPAPAAQGTLYVASVPPGQVRIDGGELLKVPVVGLSIDTGLHELTFLSPEGISISRPVLVQADEPTRTCWDFKAEDVCR